MAQAQTQEPTVETIADADLWETVADGVNTIAHDEAVFEFEPGQFKVVVKDAANVALIRQTIDADDFEHYDVAGRFATGVNTQRLEDLLKIVDDVPVSFGWDWDKYKFDFKAGDVEYDLAGIDPDSVRGSPTEVPPVKDELPYTVDITLPVDKLKRAYKIVDMNTDHATLRFGGEDAIFVIEGQGDTDASRVTIHDDDAFEWREDPPANEDICRQANDYIGEVVSILEEDTVRFVTGPECPYHLWTNRADGRVKTKLMQAPRVDNSK